MSGWAQEAMERWARERGLEFHEEGLLAPTNKVLYAGTGAGSHRAGIITQHGRHGFSSTGGFTKRPERFSMHLCRGTLPGGVEGTVAHHAYLTRGFDSDGSWHALPHTLVVVPIPDGTRAFRDVKAVGGAPPDIKVGKTIDLSGGSGPPVYQAATETIGGWRWTIDPPWDAETLRRHLATPQVLEALTTLGEEIDVDLHDGWLCLSIDQVWAEDDRLDWMCHAAARIAAGVQQAVAAHPALDHDAPVDGPRDTDQKRWIDEGVRGVQWPEAPASVAEAKAAYVNAEGSGSRKRGRKVSLIATGGAMIALIVFAMLDLIALIFGVPLIVVLAAVVFEIVVFAPFTIAAAWRAGREMGQDDLENRAAQFGLAAFAQGYAQSRGLREEDRDELRYRLPPPLPGAPLRAWHGRLGDTDGPLGRLVLWIDRTEFGTSKYALLAVVPDPGGEQPDTIGPYQVWRGAGTLILIEEVAASDRSAAKLDAIAAAARNVSLQKRDMLQAQPN